MRLKKLWLPHMLLIPLVLLLAVKFTCLSHGKRILISEGARWKGDSSRPSMYCSSEVSPSQKKPSDDDECRQIYGVSKRLVPQSPNPLHN